jgi:50S ribosomal subunit-associated GTPase HflX
MAEEDGSPLRSPRIGSQLSKILQSLQKQQETPASRSSDRKIIVREVVVALMGATGAGKSTFIRRVTSDDTVVIGDGLQSGKRGRDNHPSSVENV